MMTNQINITPLSYFSTPRVGETHRIKNQVEFYHEAVKFAKTYGLTIVEVGSLQKNLKFTITYVKYRGDTANV